MKIVKRIFAVAMAVAVVASCFAGCSSKNAEKYSKDVAILGYTKEVAPFLTDVKDGKAELYVNVVAIKNYISGNAQKIG